MDENIVTSLEAGCCISELINAKIEEHRIKHCPSCNHHIECHEALRDWPGLPAGVKFDPTDQELIEHLRGKVGVDNCGHHPLLDDFIPTLQGQDGICYTHPEKLPGITRDGMIRHFFHRPSKAYTTGNRKRRKIQTRSEEEEGGETRWHKTGKTRPVLINGEQKGCKKILVLYTNFGKHRKPEKTNWVMHQYHLGHQEEETDGELVVSKVFYQTHPRSSCSFNHVNNNAVAIASHSHSHSTIAYNDIDEPINDRCVKQVTMDVEGEAEDKRWSPEESANEEMMNGQQVKEHCNYKNLLCKEHVDVEGGLFGHHLKNGGAAVSSEASDPEEFGLVVTREKDDDRSSPTTSSITTSHSKDLAFQEEIEQEEQQQQQAATTTEWLDYSLLWAEPDTHNTWDLSTFRND